MWIIGPEQVVTKGLTLLEILVVIIIIGILAALALPNFGKAREYVLDKESFANLKLMAAAEKIYHMETASYYPKSASETDITNINNYLKLSLTEANWDYVCDTENAQATAAKGGRTWTLGYTSTGEPACSGTGCP